MKKLVKKKSVLESLFTSKSRVRILEFFIFKKHESYIREISNYLEISVSAIKKEVGNLVFAGILTKKNNIYSFVTEKGINPELKSIFLKTDFLIIPLQEAFEKISDAKFVFIFGSYAKGNFNSESDIDLFVVGNISSSAIYLIADKLEKKFGKNINPSIWGVKNLKKEKSGFIKDIFSNKIIMVKGDENELRRVIKK